MSNDGRKGIEVFLTFPDHVRLLGLIWRELQGTEVLSDRHNTLVQLYFKLTKSLLELGRGMDEEKRQPNDTG